MDGLAQWPATRVNNPECVRGKKERRHTQQRERRRVGEEPLPVPKFNRSSGEGEKARWEGGREKRHAGKGEGRLGLEGVWVWTRGLEELRGNTRYLEREDWCRTSDTGDKHCTSCPFKIFGGRLWVEMRRVWGFGAVQLQG